MGHHLSTALCAITLLGSLPATSQDNSQLLANLGTAADELHHKLPNFTCNQSVLSEELDNGKVRHHATYTTTIRAQRNDKGVLEEQLGEKSTYEVGFFSALVHHIPNPPLVVRGGFSQALDYFAIPDQLCYNYRFSPGRIDFTAHSPSPPACKSSGTQGFALLDANANVTHIERKVRLEDAAARNQAAFATVDFAPVELNGHVYHLSHHVVAEMPGNNGVLRRFTADFTSCKLFTTTVTLSPANPINPSQP